MLLAPVEAYHIPLERYFGTVQHIIMTYDYEHIYIRERAVLSTAVLLLTTVKYLLLQIPNIIIVIFIDISFKLHYKFQPIILI